MLKNFEVIEIYYRKRTEIKKSLKIKFPKKLLFIFIILCRVLVVEAQKNVSEMEPDQKISQLFAYEISRTDFEDDFKEFDKVSEDGLGFLIIPAFLSADQIAEISLKLNSRNIDPLIIYKGKEGEDKWPSSRGLGALSDNSLIENWAESSGKILLESAYDIAFNNFPGISRPSESPESLKISMNEDWEVVTEKSEAMHKGFINSGLLSIAPDFPGFRNYSEGQALKVNFDEERIKNIEIKAYEKLIKNDLKIVQISSALVNDKEGFTPFFLSENWTNRVLRRELGFQNWVMSADIRKVSEWYNARNGEIELMAFEAGNDILLNPENANATKRRIRSLIRKNKRFEDRLELLVDEVMKLKSRAGQTDSIRKAILPALEYEKILRQNITVIDESDLVPVKYLGIKKIACIHIGTEYPNVLSSYLDKYDRIKHFRLRDRFNYYEKFEELKEQIKEYDIVILPLGEIPFDAHENYGIGNQIPRFTAEISEDKEVYVLAMGNPAFIDVFPARVAKIISYEVNESAEKLLAQILFGAKEARGKLPYSTKKYAWNTGKMTEEMERLDYVYPEEVGMNTSVLSKIDEVVQEALESKASPGCQVLVAKDGHIVLEKGYGYLSYDSLEPVTTETVYDVASITKVAATLQAVMLLSEMEVIDVNRTASQYLADLRASNKKSLFISDILSHQAGLTPYIPYWKQTVGSSGLDDRYYCDNPDDWFCVEVVPGIYTIRTMEDSLWKWTLESELREKNKDGNYGYRYSDLGFYIMKKLVERKTRQPIEDFLEQNFYRPLGMSKLTFFPLAYFSPDEIAPTEQDDYFRNTVVRGTVHDQGAAMFGGVGGHAGLFSNANDLAKIMQMHLNKGVYGGQRYLRENTVETFAQRHFRNNRRGLGWDKPLRSSRNGPTSNLCSYNTFGHTGFTGTAMWADPDYGLVYVFLSNRIHPDVNNRKLIKQNIRTRIQDIIYESIFIEDINKKK